MSLKPHRSPSIPLSAVLAPMAIAIVLLVVGTVVYGGAHILGKGVYDVPFLGSLPVLAMGYGAFVILAVAIVELRFYKYILRDISLREARLRKAVNELEMEEETKATTLSGALHDDLGGGLTALRMELEMTQSNPTGQAWERCFEKVDRLMVLVRGIARTMYPKLVGDLGLTEIIREMGDKLRDGGKFDVRYSLDLEINGIPQQKALCVMRIVQESLVNVARHSNGRSVDINISCVRGSVCGSVSDDGTGRSELRDGLGITLMRERVSYLGGSLETRLTARGGIEVVFTLPVEEAA